MLTVVSESGQQSPEIQAVTPRPNYPTREGKVKTYVLKVIDRNFSERGPDNHLFFVDHGEVAVCWKDDPHFEELSVRPDCRASWNEFAERRVAEPGHVGPGLVGHEGHDPCAAEMVQGTAEEAVAARHPLTLATW